MEENAIIIGFGLLALALAVGASTVLEFDTSVTIGILLFVGVILPVLVNEYRETEDKE